MIIKSNEILPAFKHTHMPLSPTTIEDDSPGCHTQAARALPRSFNHQNISHNPPRCACITTLQTRQPIPATPTLLVLPIKTKSNILHTAPNPVNNTAPHDPLFPASEADIPPGLGAQRSHRWCVRVVSGTHMSIATMIPE
jgi:hypothetical protein